LKFWFDYFIYTSFNSRYNIESKLLNYKKIKKVLNVHSYRTAF